MNTRTCQVAMIVIFLVLLFPVTLGNPPFPPALTKVFTTTEAGSFLAYAVDPDSIIHWNRGLSPEIEFAILPPYTDLPAFGTWDETYQTIQVDAVKEAQPDLVIHYAKVNPQNTALVAEIEETLGIPTILVDNRLQALPDALRLLGDLLGKEVRGQALATFVENELAQMADFQRLQAGYAPIPVHIVSSFAAGHFDELLSLAGMVEMPTWDSNPPLPDFVLIMPHTIADPYKAIEKEGHKRIYQIPTFPANWLDPGSIFSLMGLEWLHSIAYPSYEADLAATYRALMEVFFQLNITPELLQWTLRRSGISY